MKTRNLPALLVMRDWGCCIFSRQQYPSIKSASSVALLTLSMVKFKD